MDKVGDFYEASGIDALVEYVGLNPFGGFRSDSIPRAGCRVMNLRQTLDDRTQNGYSVCIVEEVQGPGSIQEMSIYIWDQKDMNLILRITTPILFSRTITK